MSIFVLSLKLQVKYGGETPVNKVLSTNTGMVSQTQLQLVFTYLKEQIHIIYVADVR